MIFLVRASEAAVARGTDQTPTYQAAITNSTRAVGTHFIKAIYGDGAVAASLALSALDETCSLP